MAELGQLVWARYPGYEEDLRARWEEDQEECEGDTLSDWDTDSECETERTEDSHWPGLTGLAQQATALATTAQPPVISDVASSELDWLLTLQKHNLPRCDGFPLYGQVSLIILGIILVEWSRSAQTF